MASSSVGNSAASPLRCRIRKCKCGKKAAVKISETANNPYWCVLVAADGVQEELPWGAALHEASHAEMKKEIDELKNDLILLREKMYTLKSRLETLKMVAMANIAACVVIVVLFLIVMLFK